jgi:hypothetical protein
MPRLGREALQVAAQARCVGSSKVAERLSKDDEVVFIV